MAEGMVSQNSAKIPAGHRWLPHTVEPPMTASAQLLLRAMVELMGSAGRCVYPGSQILSRLLGLSRSCVWDAERELMARGLFVFTGGQRQRELRVVPPARYTEISLRRYNEVLRLMQLPVSPMPPATEPAPDPVPQALGDPSPVPPIQQQPPVNPPVEVDVEVLADPDPQPSRRTRASRASKGSKKSAKAKLPPMDDAMKAAICGSAANMEKFLLYGRGALVEGVVAEQLPPEGTNWRSNAVRNEAGEITDPRVSTWNVPQFMGYYWFRVSKWRESRKIEIRLPQWSRMAGDFKNVLATMTTTDFYKLICVTVQHFDLIRFMLGSAADRVMLDETSMSNPLVKSTAFNLSQMTEEQLAAKYGEMKQKWNL